MRLLEVHNNPVKGMWHSRLGCDSHRRDACATFLQGLRLFLTCLLLVAHCIFSRPASAETTVLSKQQPIRLAQAKLPTLEDVVFIESRVDHTSVYLGEAVNLTLTFGQLKFRGIRVQNHFKTRQVRLPDTEGFLAGKLVEESREITRDGHTYVLTNYQIPLYPTRPGKLFIGSWRWQGTVRGHTASGARTLQLDKSTDPITIAVLPLPPAPPGFKGAVGRFQLSVSMDSTSLVQGVPTRLHLEIEGTGNPQSLRAPTLPRGDWYRLGDPAESGAGAPADQNVNVLKRYTYALMPLQDGAFELGPFALTYFSPIKKDYVAVTAPALHVRVAPSEKEEQLVVVGGLSHDGQGGLRVMDDGRLPLATEGGMIDAEEPWNRTIGVLIVLPLIAFLAGYALRYGMNVRLYSGPPVSLEARLRVAMSGDMPADGLRRAILRELEAITGWTTAGMTAPELESALMQLGWEEVAGKLGEVLRQCEAFRYAGAQPDQAALEGLAALAGAAMDQAGAWGAKR